MDDLEGETGHTSERGDVIDGSMETADGGAAEALRLSGESAQAAIDVGVRESCHVPVGRMGIRRGMRMRAEGGI